MAIVRGNLGGNAQAGANMNWNHNNISSDAGILLMFAAIANGAAITAVTYGGVALTEEQNYNNDISVWFLVGPPAGVNLLQLTQAGAQSITGITVDYSGVDQADPFGVIKGLWGEINNGGPALLSEDLATRNAWMCVDAGANGNFNAVANNLVQGAGQASLRRENFWDGANVSMAIEVSEEPSTSATTTMSWTGMFTTDHWGQIAVPLRPHIPFVTRLTEYEFNVWDPLQRIVARDGHEVSPNEVRADKWGKLLGFRSPSSKVFASLADSPDAFYISGVTSDGETARITPDEKLFADMLLKRLVR